MQSMIEGYASPECKHRMHRVEDSVTKKFVGMACVICKKFVREEKSLAVVTEKNTVLHYGAEPRPRRDPRF